MNNAEAEKYNKTVEAENRTWREYLDMEIQKIDSQIAHAKMLGETVKTISEMIKANLRFNDIERTTIVERKAMLEKLRSYYSDGEAEDEKKKDKRKSK